MSGSMFDWILIGKWWWIDRKGHRGYHKGYMGLPQGVPSQSVPSRRLRSDRLCFPVCWWVLIGLLIVHRSHRLLLSPSPTIDWSTNRTTLITNCGSIIAEEEKENIWSTTHPFIGLGLWNKKARDISYDFLVPKDGQVVDEYVVDE